MLLSLDLGLVCDEAQRKATLQGKADLNSDQGLGCYVVLFWKGSREKTPNDRDTVSVETP